MPKWYYMAKLHDTTHAVEHLKFHTFDEAIDFIRMAGVIEFTLSTDCGPFEESSFTPIKLDESADFQSKRHLKN